MKRVLILRAAGSGFHDPEVISRDNSMYAVEELTRPGLAEVLATFEQEHEPALGGARK